jgi:steroid-24-oyl-CoA synthetase
MSTVDAAQLAWGHEVVTDDVLGHPCLVFERRRHRLAELLVDGRRFVDRDYLVQGSRRLSFGAHERAVSRAVGVLAERGVRPGDRVMVFGANAVEWVIGFWAILAAGGVVVLGNAWWSQAEVEHALGVAEPRFAIVDDRRRRMVAARVATIGYADLSPTVRTGDDHVCPLDCVAEDDPAVVLFTSGTSGLPKGAVLSHRGLISTLQSLMVVTRRLPAPGAPLSEPTTALLSLPLFHVGGLQQVITPMIGGGGVVFTEGRFDPAEVVRLLEAEQVRTWSAVPTMVTRVLDHLEATGHPGVRCVRTVGLGGSPVPQHLRERVRVGFPNSARGVAVTYGLSEACGVLATGAGDEILRRVGTVGRPLPVTTIRIDDPDENGCGEIVVRSPSVMLAYLAAPGAADDGPVTGDRWLRTGDIGRLDDDGYLYVTDRSKDVVIRGGENIATPHVEGRLLAHPAVAEVAVVGLPHPVLGEELGAVVVLRQGAEGSSAELAAFAAAELAYFEVPTRWRLRREPLPQNTTGKVLKRIVRQQWIESADGAGTPSFEKESRERHGQS